MGVVPQILKTGAVTKKQKVYICNQPTILSVFKEKTSWKNQIIIFVTQCSQNVINLLCPGLSLCHHQAVIIYFSQ